MSNRSSPNPGKRGMAEGGDFPGLADSLKRLFDSSLDLLCAVSFDGYLKHVNPAWERALGWSREELLEKPLLEFVPPEDRRRMETEPRKLHSGAELASFETRLLCKDGSSRWFAWTSPAPRPGDELLYAIGRDITEQKRAEESLRKKTFFVELLQAVTTAANEASTAEGAMAFTLQRICEQTGWPVGHVYLTAEDASGHSIPTGIWYLQNPEQFEQFRKTTEVAPLPRGVGLVGKVITTGKPVWMRDVSEDPDFTRARDAQAAGLKTAIALPVLVAQEVAGVLEFYSSTTEERDLPLLEVMSHVGEQLGRVLERQRAEKKLHTSERRTRMIIDAAYDAFVAMDADGLIVDWNPRAEAIFGWSREEALGRPLAETIIPPRYREAHRQGLKRFLTTGEVKVLDRRIEIAGLRRDGEEFPVELMVSSIPSGKSHLFTAFLRDIGRRKGVEAALASHARDVAASNEELEAFSYSVSHDLRTPLRAIDGFSLAILEDYGARLDEPGREYLKRIRAAAQRMAQLIDDLLNLSRLTLHEMRCEPVDLTLVASSVADELRKSDLGRQATFVIAEGMTAIGDPRLLRVALENLLGNAWKFTSKRDGARIEFGVTDEDGRLVYFVSDNGAGFDMAYSHKLFVPFQRLHSPAEFGGTGIGLATVKRIVQRHGGRIWAEGQPEQGATFFLML